MIISTMMVSSWESSPRGPRIIIHELKAVKAQSSTRSGGSEGQGWRENQQQSFDDAESMTSAPEDSDGRAGIRGSQQRGP